jgi:hypothetical protein
MERESRKVTEERGTVRWSGVRRVDTEDAELRRVVTGVMRVQIERVE